MRVEMFTFLIAGAIVLSGALGVVLFRNPVHNALSLVATLFGIAILFIAQEAYFLAAIQVIVYAGAIVVLFLFVIMLLGVDRSEALEKEPIPAQRIVGILLGVAVLAVSLVVLLAGGEGATGAKGATASLSGPMADVNRLGRVLFTDDVFAFEITAVLLTVAVVGAVVLSRRPTGDPIDLDEFPDGPAVKHEPLFPELDDEGPTDPGGSDEGLFHDAADHADADAEVSTDDAADDADDADAPETETETGTGTEQDAEVAG